MDLKIKFKEFYHHVLFLAILASKAKKLQHPNKSNRCNFFKWQFAKNPNTQIDQIVVIFSSENLKKSLRPNKFHTCDFQKQENFLSFFSTRTALLSLSFSLVKKVNREKNEWIRLMKKLAPGLIHVGLRPFTLFWGSLKTMSQVRVRIFKRAEKKMGNSFMEFSGLSYLILFSYSETTPNTPFQKYIHPYFLRFFSNCLTQGALWNGRQGGCRTRLSRATEAPAPLR